MKIIRNLLGFVLVLTLLTGCGVPPIEQSPAAFYDERLVVWQDTLYYADESDEGLYCADPDLSGMKKLAEDCTKILGVSERGIVFDGDKGLLRVDLAGGNPVLLAEDVRTSYRATRQWVYYENCDNEFWRVSIDGKKREKLFQGSGYPIETEKDWLFYYQLEENSLYFCHDSGKPVAAMSARDLYGSGVTYSICSDGRDFYIGTSTGLYRYDGSQRLTKLVIGSATGLQAAPEGVLYFDYLGQLQILPYGSTYPVLLVENVLSKALYREGWVYYLSGEESAEHLLCRVRADGTDRVRVSDQVFHSLQYASDWIYCEGIPAYAEDSIDSDAQYPLYRVKPDGSRIEVFSSWTRPGSESSGSRLIFTPGYVYTVKTNYSDKYFTVSLTGEDRRDTGPEDRYFAIDTPRGQYYTTMENKGIYLAGSDGVKRKLCAVPARDMQFWEDWLYFISSEEDPVLFRMKWDGSVTEQVSSLPVTQYLVSGGSIYTYSSEDLSVSRCALDGSNPITLFSAANPTLLGVQEDWLYYEASRLYKVRISGADSQLVCKPEVTLYSPVLADGWIYANTGDNQTCRVNPQTGEVTGLSHYYLTYVADEGQYVYFITGDSLVRMNKSGLVMETLVEDVAWCNLVRGRFFCCQTRATTELTGLVLR